MAKEQFPKSWDAWIIFETVIEKICLKIFIVVQTEFQSEFNRNHHMAIIKGA